MVFTCGFLFSFFPGHHAQQAAKHRKGLSGNVQMKKLSSSVQMPGPLGTMQMMDLSGSVQTSLLQDCGFLTIYSSPLPSVGLRLLTGEPQEQ